MLKILHTADLHFGLPFNRYPTIADRLKEERLDALKAMVQYANDMAAHAFVVAGDLFDNRNVAQKLIKSVKAALASFEGDVFVIPGNHDWHNASANENKLWDWFEEAPGDNVHLLNKHVPYTFTLNHQEVVFPPCGCDQKHSNQNLLGWVKAAHKDESCINIGIAHGNVDGFGLDEEGRYFNMPQQELKEAGMDCWLLGHIHAPHPVGDTAGDELFFFAGNHCPDSWKSERTGGAWLIEIDDHKQMKGSRWSYSGIRFRDRAYTVHHSNDVQNMVNQLGQLDAPQTILRLTVTGSLTAEESEECQTQIDAAFIPFLYKELHWNVRLKITPDAINKIYASGTVPHTLLTQLSQSKEDELAMQLAFQIINNIS